MDKGVSTDSGIEQIRAIVAAMLARKGLPPVAPDANLWDSGLASMDMVNLMLSVEEAFDIQLPESQMTPDNFRTVAAIEALISGLT